ncbi:MAG: hypothetical protein CMB99_01195 [Flavobacteriaceae bacterium]|nr:hypothetical protein [Flavobacteriaceae bacterium]|tara:strand:+ start:3655 stop:3855 length:201 start_codon:yes stop_codon:yes gene_type:complete
MLTDDQRIALYSFIDGLQTVLPRPMDIFKATVSDFDIDVADLCGALAVLAGDDYDPMLEVEDFAPR